MTKPLKIEERNGNSGGDYEGSWNLLGLVIDGERGLWSAALIMYNIAWIYLESVPGCA